MFNEVIIFLKSHHGYHFLKNCTCHCFKSGAICKKKKNNSLSHSDAADVMWNHNAISALPLSSLIHLWPLFIPGPSDSPRARAEQECVTARCEWVNGDVTVNKEPSNSCGPWSQRRVQSLDRANEGIHLALASWIWMSPALERAYANCSDSLVWNDFHCSVRIWIWT